MDLHVDRIDHLGLIAGVMKDLHLINQIDVRMLPYPDEAITAGEAIAGMILCGLGFSDRPLSLTPQFFTGRPIGFLLGREEIQAEHFNHFKLGRVLEHIYEFDCERFFAEVSASLCSQENIDRRFGHLDTTSFGVHGEYAPDTPETQLADTEERAIELRHGYSRDHRPDLKQFVTELIVSGDGGIPLLCQCWSGNKNDSEIFSARVAKLKASFCGFQQPRYLVGDSKLYSEENRQWLKDIPFITRVPGHLKAVEEMIMLAQGIGEWTPLGESNYWQEFDHQGERWIVVYSEAAENRETKSLAKAVAKEKALVEKRLNALQRKRFGCPEDAEEAAHELPKGLTYIRFGEATLEPEEGYDSPGRPSKNAAKKTIGWRVGPVHWEVNQLTCDDQEFAGSCYVLASNIPHDELSAEEVVAGYKQQSVVERGFRFLKDPLFFTSAFFLKKPSRIQGLLVVMTLALLVYAIAERRLRKVLAAQKETLPNQIKKQTSRPTLRWVFQMLDGIHRVHLTVDGQRQIVMQGLNEVKTKILRLFGPPICQYYQIEVLEGCSM